MDEETDEIEENKTGEQIDVAEEDCEETVIEDFDGIRLNDVKQIAARNVLVNSYRLNKVKRKKEQVTSKSVKILHGDYSVFEKVWHECQGVKKYGV